MLLNSIQVLEKTYDCIEYNHTKYKILEANLYIHTQNFILLLAEYNSTTKYFFLMKDKQIDRLLKTLK